MTRIRDRLGFYLGIALAGMVSGPTLAHAEGDTMGPVTVSVTNCGPQLTVNLMTYVCANPYKCDYALGVNNYSGTPVNYTLKVDAPANYAIYAPSARSSKGYDAFRLVQAPQAAGGPKVKVEMSCTRADAANGPPTKLR